MNIKNYRCKLNDCSCVVVAEGIRGTERVKADNPEAVVKVMQDIAEINRSPCEQFWAIHLNIKNQIIAIELISQGGLSGVCTHPREVFRSAIIRNSGSIILAHNHPSGDPAPSREDMSTTKILADAGKILGIRVLDHVIIGDGGRYTSLRKEGFILDE